MCQNVQYMRSIVSGQGTLLREPRWMHGKKVVLFCDMKLNTLFNALAKFFFSNNIGRYLTSINPIGTQHENKDTVQPIFVFYVFYFCFIVLRCYQLISNNCVKGYNIFFYFCAFRALSLLSVYLDCFLSFTFLTTLQLSLCRRFVEKGENTFQRKK